MLQAICRTAKTTSLIAGIATSLFLVSLALPHRLITFQLVVFVILKLCSIKKAGDAGGANDQLPGAWYDELYPSFHAAAASYYPTPYEPMPPEVVKEVVLEEEEEAEDEGREEFDAEKDVQQLMMASMDEVWKAVTEGRSDAKKTNGTWERYLQRAQADAEWAMSGARRKPVTSYKKKDHIVDAKMLRQKKKEEDEVELAVWRRPKEVHAVGLDELFRRVEAFIRMQHDHLRLQRLESERRRFLERLQHSS